MGFLGYRIGRNYRPPTSASTQPGELKASALHLRTTLF